MGTVFSVGFRDVHNVYMVNCYCGIAGVGWYIGLGGFGFGAFQKQTVCIRCQIIIAYYISTFEIL